MPSRRAAACLDSFAPRRSTEPVAAHIPLRPRARAARVASTASIARASIEARASHRIANRIASRTAGVVLDEADGVSNVAASLAQLLERPGYRRHLQSCGTSQEIMLGHADTRLRQEVKAMLRATAADYGVTLKFTAGMLEGATHHKIVALVDTTAALATPLAAPRKVFADSTNDGGARRREATGCWCRR